MLPEIDSVVSFYYHKEPDKWRIGRVVSVRDLEDKPLTPATLERGRDVRRSRHLVTCVMSDKTYRAFYIDKVKWRKVGNIRRKLLKYGGISFEAP